MKINSKNERVKRRFYDWLKEAVGYSPQTIDGIAAALDLFEEYTGHKDFLSFAAEQAVLFKEWFGTRERQGRPMALSTMHGHMRSLRKFFAWLHTQPGYKTRVTPDKIEYLKLTLKDERMATQFVPRNFPPLEYVQQLVGSIKVSNEVDMRDRALISFTLLTGIRNAAIATLSMNSFDQQNMLIIQNPIKGVKTKYSKYIPSIIFKFDESMLAFFMEWVTCLKGKGFGSGDPLFPRTKSVKDSNGFCFIESGEVEPVFWSGTGCISAIFKRRAQAAGLPAFPPHTFRHLAVKLALEQCRTGEQIKAVSQNFGHAHIATTLTSYANFNPAQLAEILHGLDREAAIDPVVISKFIKIITKYQGTGTNGGGADGN